MPRLIFKDVWYDRCEDKKQAEEKFKEIAEAYEQIKKKYMEAEA